MPYCEIQWPRFAPARYPVNGFMVNHPFNVELSDAVTITPKEIAPVKKWQTMWTPVPESKDQCRTVLKNQEIQLL